MDRLAAIIDDVISFRDPAGSCFQVDNRILRVLHADSAAECEAFLKSVPDRDFVTLGDVVRTRNLSVAEVEAIATKQNLDPWLSSKRQLTVSSTKGSHS